jgi:hypothetical protein
MKGSASWSWLVGLFVGWLVGWFGWFGLVGWLVGLVWLVGW